MVLDFIEIIIVVVCSVLSIILFFKVWGMCNNVDKIVNQIGNKKIEIDELIYLSKTNDPTFNTKLHKAIYDDLYRVYKMIEVVDEDSEIDKIRAKWEARCRYYSWQYPTVFAEVKTYNDFITFIFAYAPNDLH